jgi:DNA mismatch endonuclease (patch repair protein)
LSRCGSATGTTAVRAFDLAGGGLAIVSYYSQVDTLTPDERSARMARVKARDSRPEMLVRHLVHTMGFRYRLHDRRLPGTPDLVFPSRRKVIFVHGCFWHQHHDPVCKLARMPKSRLDFWQPKLQGNRDRDLRHQSELDALGWRFLVVWECKMRNREQLQNTLRAFLGDGGKG